MIHEWIFNHWKRLALAGLIALIVGYGTNFYYLRSIPALADQRDRWEGQVDEKLRAGESRDQAIFSLMKEMREESDKGRKDIMHKIDAICSDITDVKVQAARNGMVYGAGSGGGILVILQLIQFLAKKRNGK